MVPRLFFEFIYIQYPFYKYLGKKKKVGKKQDTRKWNATIPEIHVQVFFVEMFASKQKKPTSIFEAWFLAVIIFLSLENQSRWAGEVS